MQQDIRFSCALAAALILSLSPTAGAQVQVTGSLNGTVTDPAGAIVPGAKVKIANAATGGVFNLIAGDDGYFNAPAVPTGTYSVQVSAAGFRTAILQDVKVDVGTPKTVKVQLEIGQLAETVVVEAEATPVVTSTTAIATTVTGRQITELPLSSRSALDLAFQIPGAAGGGSVRYSSVNALPHGALSVAIDGVNVQDNLLKSSSGGAFYTYIQPRIDAVEEVTVSSSASSASSSEGAVQMTFVTRRGTNAWHGGLFEYLRNDYFNANTWFNNTNKLPRQVLKLNQYGGRIGGPIIKDKLFFFGVWDEFRLPNSISRTRTVLTPSAINGNFTYRGSDGVTRSISVLNLAAANGFRSKPDANILAMLQKIDSLRSGGQVGITPQDLFRDNMTFNNVGSQHRWFPTTRLDWNINDRMQVEAVWYFQGFRSFPDTLNGYDRSYPGFETLNGRPAQGGQDSNRHQTSAAFRWTLTPRIANELRAGENGGTVVFNGGLNQELYPGNTRLAWPLSLTSPLNRGRDSRRNSPMFTLQDNLAWQKGKHTLNFGLVHSYLRSWDNSIGSAVPAANLGVTSNDPINSMFNSTNLPGIQSSDIANAQNLYALLTGRISGVSGDVNVDAKSLNYVPYAPLEIRLAQRMMALFVSDSFRLRPSVTLNFGLRWDYQGPVANTNNIYTMPQGGYSGLWDVSGPDNLFKPGTLSGQPTQMVPMTQPWDKHYRNFAPSAGIGWSPNSGNGILKAIFGKGGAFRAGYAVNFSREGLSHLTSLAGANPGPTASASLIADRDFKSGELFYDGRIPPLVTVPTAYKFPLPMSSLTYTGSSSNWYDPAITPPKIHSFSFGLQREIFRETVLEVRYVGNRGRDLWRQINLNEVNVVENGFLKEFTAAQNNLALCTSNRAACTGSATGALRFDNRGVPGQVNLPILQAAFAGTTGFTSSTFVTNLQQGTAGSMASTIANSNTYMPNVIKGGFSANLFLVSPTTANGGAWLLKNGGYSSYDSVQIEVRRRMHRGLLLLASYVFSKGLTNLGGDSSASAVQPMTLRNYDYSRVPSPYDIRHVVKLNWLYELPFGPGKKWLGTRNPVASRIIGGWQINGIARIQSGQPFQLTSGRATFNQYEAGVIPLVSRAELQSMGRIVKNPSGYVTWVDPKLIGPDGRANPAYLMTPTTPGQVANYLYLYGPQLVRIDATLAKSVRINERMGFQLRAEVLNVPNTVNFMQASASSSVAGASSIQSTSFGRTTNYYQDFNSNQDPGGRVIQLVARFDF